MSTHVCGATKSNGEPCQVHTKEGRCWRHKSVKSPAPKAKAKSSSPKAKAKSSSPKAKAKAKAKAKSSSKTKPSKTANLKFKEGDYLASKTEKDGLVTWQFAKVAHVTPTGRFAFFPIKKEELNKTRYEDSTVTAVGVFDEPEIIPTFAKNIALSNGKFTGGVWDVVTLEQLREGFEEVMPYKTIAPAKSIFDPQKMKFGLDFVTSSADTYRVYFKFSFVKKMKAIDFARLALKDKYFLTEFIAMTKRLSQELNHYMIKFPKSSSDLQIIVIEDKSLDRPADSSVYAEYFKPGEKVVSFWNKSHDTLLVVPCPPGNYTTLKEFSMNADMNLQVDFWRRVFDEYVKLGSKQEIWLNTHGHGVPWLHVRLDTSPKYYGALKI